MTIPLRENWLHRGGALQDMDIQTYAELMERVEKPASGSRLTNGILQQHVFPFDAHYKMSSGYIQVLRPAGQRRIARFNVPNCLRENANEGEAHALCTPFSLITATLTKARPLR